MTASEKEEECTSNEASRSRKLLILFIVGFFIIFLGIIILIATALFFEGGSVNFGGVIFIWFVPIVFGAGQEASLMVLFAIILAVLGIIMYLILRSETMKKTLRLFLACLFFFAVIGVQKYQD